MIRGATGVGLFLFVTAGGASQFVAAPVKDLPVIPRAAEVSTVQQASPAATAACGPSGTSHIRTTLYFGLTRPSGIVSEREWRQFVSEQVTPQFPDGLTIWTAEGQWRRPDGRIGRERSKVLLLVHDDTAAARAMLATVVTAYKQRFQQESVLWESTHVCATF